MDLIGSAKTHFGASFDKEEFRKALDFCFNPIKDESGPWLVLKNELK
jgi:hypothetical protein